MERKLEGIFTWYEEQKIHIKFELLHCMFFCKYTACLETIQQYFSGVIYTLKQSKWTNIPTLYYLLIEGATKGCFEKRCVKILVYRLILFVFPCRSFFKNIALLFPRKWIVLDVLKCGTCGKIFPFLKMFHCAIT